jgi:hypothetical protein
VELECRTLVPQSFDSSRRRSPVCGGENDRLGMQNPPTLMSICLAKQLLNSHRAVTRRASNRIIDLAGQLVFA